MLNTTEYSILVIDPGETIGIAFFIKRLPSNKYELEWTMALPLKDCLRLENLIQVSSQVVYEKPYHSSKTKFNWSPYHIEGMLMFLCTKYKKPLNPRSPQMMVAPTKYAKALMRQFSTLHEQDAVCHGLSYIGPDRVLYKGEPVL